MNIIVSDRISSMLNEKKFFSSEEFFREQLLKKIEKRREEKKREKVIQALEQINEIMHIINYNQREDRDPITMTNLIIGAIGRQIQTPPIFKKVISPIKLIDISKKDILTFKLEEGIQPQDLKYYLIEVDQKEFVSFYDEKEQKFVINEDDFFFRDYRNAPSLRETAILGSLIKITKN